MAVPLHYVGLIDGDRVDKEAALLGRISHLSDRISTVDDNVQDMTINMMHHHLRSFFVSTIGSPGVAKRVAYSIKSDMNGVGTRRIRG